MILPWEDLETKILDCWDRGLYPLEICKLLDEQVSLERVYIVALQNGRKIQNPNTQRQFPTAEMAADNVLQTEKMKHEVISYYLGRGGLPIIIQGQPVYECIDGKIQKDENGRPIPKIRPFTTDDLVKLSKTGIDSHYIANKAFSSEMDPSCEIRKDRVDKLDALIQAKKKGQTNA